MGSVTLTLHFCLPALYTHTHTSYILISTFDSIDSLLRSYSLFPFYKNYHLHITPLKGSKMCQPIFSLVFSTTILYIAPLNPLISYSISSTHSTHTFWRSLTRVVCILYSSCVIEISETIEAVSVNSKF